MSEPLVLKDFSGVPEITPSAFEMKRKALAKAGPIARVANDAEQESAVDALRDLKALRNGMEASRKAIKAPVLELGRKIDAIASDFLVEATRQEGRLQGMINHYQRKQLELRNEEERKLEDKAKEAEKLKEQAALLGQRAAAFAAAGDDVEAAKLLREAEALEAQAFDAKMTLEITSAPVIEKPKGLVVRSKINFQVTNAILFVQAHPDFWKWNEENESLKLDRMRVLDELNKDDGLFRRTHYPEELAQGEDEALVQPAGLRTFRETKSHVR